MADLSLDAQGAVRSAVQGGVQRAGTLVNVAKGNSPRIHACPPGLAMAGIQWNLNQILCEIRVATALPRRPGVLRKNR